MADKLIAVETTTRMLPQLVEDEIRSWITGYAATAGHTHGGADVTVQSGSNSANANQFYADYLALKADSSSVQNWASNFDIGVSATTLSAGSAASVSITGGPVYSLMFGIPRGEEGQTGETGPAGPPNVLSIGTVQQGGTADATITGTSPSQVLNLTLGGSERRHRRTRPAWHRRERAVGRYKRQACHVPAYHRIDRRYRHGR